MLNKKKSNKYLKQIVYIPILFSIFIAIAILGFARYNLYNEFQRHIKDDLATSVHNEEILSKQRVENIFKYLNHLNSIFPNNIEKQKKFATEYINDQKNIKRYIFVYNNVNLDGGDKFAQMYINPNRVDLIGKYIDDSYKDVKGKEFRKEFLKEIREDGESFVTYYYKEVITDKITQKTSYFKYYPNFNWIIATGVYLDEIYSKQTNEQKNLFNKIEKRFKNIIIILIFIIILYSLLIYFIMSKIKNILEKQDSKINHHKDILKIQLTKQLEKLRKKNQQLIQQSRFATMGEMIGNIAHQWRQPLNNIGAVMMKLEMLNESKCKNKKIDTIVEDTNNSLSYLSKTIDDFRNFFKSDKIKEEFSTQSVINQSIAIIKTQLDNHNIKLLVDDRDGKIKLYTYKNELIQVILNIINNSKDVLIQKQKDIGFDAKITIIIEDDINKNIIITIKDNGGGIPNNLIDKIFDPYFTTKFKSQGTGIGLYMSKMIIEKNMNGTLTVSNDNEGATFKIGLENKDIQI